MSDTPETNNARRVSNDESLPKYIVSADVCERIEIQRDEAMKKLGECRRLLDECYQLSEVFGGQEDIRRMLKKRFDAETF